MTGPALEVGPDGRRHVFDCPAVGVVPGPCNEKECDYWCNWHRLVRTPRRKKPSSTEAGVKDQ